MSKKIALWIKGGITSLSFFLLMTYVISPLLNSITITYTTDVNH